MAYQSITRLGYSVLVKQNFLRPRPGAARMYPETDIPPIIISKDELMDAEEKYSKIMG